jgi:hypothetical protein
MSIFEVKRGRRGKKSMTTAQQAPTNFTCKLPNHGNGCVCPPVTGVTNSQSVTTSKPPTAAGTTSSDGSACGNCGTMTKRTSGLCKKCDPAKLAKAAKAETGGTSKAKTAKPQVAKNTNSKPLSVDEIGQCAYEFVPQGYGKDAGGFRQCNIAVRLPATHCHHHGGEQGTSLGRSVAKATAEAGRGECYPVAAEVWESAAEKLAYFEGQLASMMATDTSKLSAAFAKFYAQQKEDGTARFKGMNPMLLFIQHAEMIQKANPDMPTDEVYDLASDMMTRPHRTKNAWEEEGRELNEDAQGLVVIWAKPGARYDRSEWKQKDGESDAEFENRKNEMNRKAARFGSHFQYPVTMTDGDDSYEREENPLAAYVPAGHGDANAVINTLLDVMKDRGIEVEMVDKKKKGAFAYWQAGGNQGKGKIVVWKGMGGGDPRAVLHAFAHEAGHQSLGHSTYGENETTSPDKEAAAESFAYLFCAHYGVDVGELGAEYVKGWQKAQGLNDMRAGGVNAMRSAAKAFQGFLLETGQMSEAKPKAAAQAAA